eukprot:1522053-Amphidinium_carterae.1
MYTRAGCGPCLCVSLRLVVAEAGLCYVATGEASALCHRFSSYMVQRLTLQKLCCSIAFLTQAGTTAVQSRAVDLF